jgi:ferredoxin
MAVTATLRIDPTRCRGHAICVLFCSDGIDLDRWGYGRVMEADIVDTRAVKRARRAAAACPNNAVVVTERDDVAGPDGSPAGRGQTVDALMRED